MAPTKWACIIATSLLLSLGMSTAHRSLLMSSPKGQETDQPTDFDLHGSFARKSGSSSEGAATASSDMGIWEQDMPDKAKGQEADDLTDFDLHGAFAQKSGSSSDGAATASSDMGIWGQDMLDKARPDHREMSMVNGWDMDLHDEGCSDRHPHTHDNPGVHNEPEPIPRFPDDPYNPPLSQWQGQFMYCTPMSCQGRKEDYVPGVGGDCAGFSLLIDYPPPPPPFGQSRVSENPVHSPNESKPDGHTVPSSEPVAFPPETYGSEMSDTSGGTWEEPMIPGHE